MNLSRTPWRIGIGLVCAGTALWGCPHKQNLPGALAHLENLAPEVTVRQAQQTEDQPGQPLAELYDGDVVKTADNGAADIVFSGNNRIHLGPNGSLLVQRQGSTGAEIGAIVLTGQITATAGGHGSELLVGTPMGQARISGTTVTVLDVSIAGGMEVKLGQVELIQPDSQQRVLLQVGQVATFAYIGAAKGFVVGTAADKAPAAPPRQTYGRWSDIRGVAQLRTEGENAWKNVSGSTPVGQGDTLHVGDDSAARLQLDEGTEVHFLGNNNVSFAAPSNDGQRRRYPYVLNGGNAQLSVRKSSERDAGQQLRIAGMAVEVAPSEREAQVAVSHSGAQAHVLVRYGSAQLADGNTIAAGEVADLEDGKLVGAVRDAFADAVPLPPARDAVLYYQQQVPPVRFQADSAALGEGQVIDLSPDRHFASISHSERLRAGFFANDGIGSGTTFWRLGQQPASRLDIVAEPNQPCLDCKRKLRVDDSGQHLSMVYQNNMPQVVAHWMRNAEAQQYELQVFAQQDLTKPLWQKKTTQLFLPIPDNILGEGAFVWRVLAYDKNGHHLLRGPDNGLRFTHDISRVGLSIETPANGEHLHSSSLLSQGSSQPGTQLFINGEQVRCDSKHRFRQTLSLQPGANRLIYRLVEQGHPDHYYTRTVLYDR